MQVTNVDFQKLELHDFSILLLDGLQSSLKEGEFKGYFEYVPSPSDIDTLSKKNQYIVKVFRATSTASSLPRALCDILENMGRFPSEKQIRKTDGSIYRHIQYHFAQFLIYHCACQDIAGILINEILQCGLTPSPQFLKKLRKNPQVVNLGLNKHIDKFEKLSFKYREHRNFFAHQVLLPRIANFEKISIIETGKRASDKIDRLQKKKTPSYPVSFGMIRGIYEEEHSSFSNELKKEVSIIFEAFLLLFDDMVPIFNAYEPE